MDVTCSLAQSMSATPNCSLERSPPEMDDGTLLQAHPLEELTA